jgi:hypothetical protein
MVYIGSREQDLRLGRNRMHKGDGCNQPNRAGGLPGRNASISKPMVAGMKLSVPYNSPLHTAVVSGVRRYDWTRRSLGSHAEQPYRYQVGTYLTTSQYDHVFTSQTYFPTLNFQVLTFLPTIEAQHGNGTIGHSDVQKFPEIRVQAAARSISNPTHSVLSCNPDPANKL